MIQHRRPGRFHHPRGKGESVAKCRIFVNSSNVNVNGNHNNAPLLQDLEGIMKKYFRHNRFSSLQRQLNMYGFSKKTRGGSKDLHFHNPLFYRNMTKEDFELVVSSKRRKDAEKQMR